MQLHSIQESSHEKKPQRIGRSGKRGSYSGRGVKGQKSRSGHVIRPAERDLIIRLPKRRGFANKEKSVQAVGLNLEDIAKAIEKHAGAKPIEITVAFLRQVKLLPRRFDGKVKLLGDGEIAVALSIGKNISLSKSAKEKIEKAGGSVMVNEK